MEVHIKGRHVDMTEQFRQHVEDKVNKLSRFYDRIKEVEVIFDHESEQFTCELIVRVDHKITHIAKDSGPDTMSLVDSCVLKAERQIVKHKEKTRTKKGHTAADGTSA